jgi:hypothetical protein
MQTPPLQRQNASLQRADRNRTDNTEICDNGVKMKTHRGREETREAQREWSLGWREFGVRLAFSWRERAGKKAKTGAREACRIDTYMYLKFIRTYYYTRIKRMYLYPLHLIGNVGNKFNNNK